jgi:hypothetical protein
VGALTAGATDPAAAETMGATADVAADTGPGAEPALAAAEPVVPVAAETTGAAADVAAETALPMLESAGGLAGAIAVAAADGAAELVPEPVLATAGCAAAAEPVVSVAAETTELTADVAPETAALPVPGFLAGSAGGGLVAVDGSDPAADVAADVAAEATGAATDVAAGAAPEPALVAGCAGAADPVAPVAAEVADAAAGVAGAVAAEVTGAAAEVTVEVADTVTADVAGASADVGESAACACRDSPSKTATTPIVKIVTCTARRAMCRNSGWDTRAPARSGEAARPDFPQ